MAGPSNHGDRGAHLAGDQRAGSEPDESNLQVALPMLSLDQRFVLADPLVEPLQSFDPEFDALLAAIAYIPDPAPTVTGDGSQAPIIGHHDQVPIIGSHGQAVHDDAVVPEAEALSNRGPVDYSDYPARNTRRRGHAQQVAAPAPYYARGGRRGRGRARGSLRADRDHIETERNRRREMNGQFEALRQMLPSTEARMDRAAIVLAAIDYIAALEQELASLHQESLERTTHFQSQGFVRVNHTTHTTITTPATTAADPSTLSSVVSANVTLSVVYMTSFITVSSRHGPDHMRLYARVLAVLHSHRLDVVAGTVSAQNNNTVGYTFQCQANAGWEMMNGELHAALQYAVDGYNGRV